MFTSFLNGVRWQSALDFIYPPLCVACGEFDSEHDIICQKCQSAIDTYDSAICVGCLGLMDSNYNCGNCKKQYPPLFVLGDYSTSLREVVIQYKFKGITSPSTIFTQLIYDTFSDEINKLSPTALVPIPLHPSREAIRGYNQSTLLAVALAKLTDLPVKSKILVRKGKRKPQARLDLKHRADNIKGVFSCPSPSKVKEIIILVDDVVTSGATIREATETLVASGHIVCGVVAVAHGR